MVRHDGLSHVRDAALASERRRPRRPAQRACALCRVSRAHAQGDIALYVAPKGNRNLVLWDKTSAARQTVGKIDLSWRGVTYDVYLLQKVTGLKPVLAPPPGDPFYVAAPN